MMKHFWVCRHKTDREIFNPRRVFILLCLCVIFFVSILPVPLPGIATGYAEPRFSISSKNEPLQNTLVKISDATGYQIEITKGWKNKPLTADLNQVSLEEGMKAIIRGLGRPNYVMIVDDRKKKVEIRIIDDSSTGKKEDNATDIITKTDVRDRRPPSEDEMGGSIPDRESMEMERERQQEEMAERELRHREMLMEMERRQGAPDPDDD